jgi:hypothetical protein
MDQGEAGRWCGVKEDELINAVLVKQGIGVGVAASRHRGLVKIEDCVLPCSFLNFDVEGCDLGAVELG